MSNSVSILLGAGFSAPMGYPTGAELNKLLFNCKGTEFGFHTSGVLCVDKEKGRPDWGYKTSYDVEFDFCLELIKGFNEAYGFFDYEEFYDFLLKSREIQEKWVDELAQPFLGTYHKQTSDLVNKLDNIYNQMVSHYLVDGEGNQWYGNAPHVSGPTFSGYTGILNCLQSLGEQYVVNIHTLNHDLFFERLNISDWIAGELCDGFEELGSPYYGRLRTKDGNYKVRLSRYTGNYNNKFRLYKLHGSRDYGLYYESHGAVFSPHQYIKTKYGVNFGELYKEVQKNNGALAYEHCWVNYHADFLTGTTSKIERYSEPLLFKELLKHFRKNLECAKKLIIIGYGGKDSEINRILIEHFDFKEKPVYIVDAYPGESVENLKDTLNASLIKKDLEHINLKNLDL